MRLLMMGPPGSGKGTQAALVARQLGVPAISTGGIFRSYVQRHTELGQAVDLIMRSGGLVPDDITIRVVAERLGVSEGTVFRVAKQFVESGGRVDEVVMRKERLTPPVEPKVTGDVEARIIALACSQPPPGRTRWTLRLLERQVSLTEGIPQVGHSTIGKVLKRGRLPRFFGSS